MSTYPPQTRANFFAAVDRWQSDFIIKEAAAVEPSITSLSPPIVQLLLSQPSLLDTPQISGLVDTTIAETPNTISSATVALGITPLLVHLLRSSTLDRRKWAETHIAACGKRKSSFDISVGSGVQEEIESLASDDTLAAIDKWRAIRAILKSGCLSQEAIERGVLRGEQLHGKKASSKRILPTIVPLLGTETDCKPSRRGFSLISQSSPYSWISLLYCSMPHRREHFGHSILHLNYPTPCSQISRTIRLSPPCLRTGIPPIRILRS